MQGGGPPTYRREPMKRRTSCLVAVASAAAIAVAAQTPGFALQARGPGPGPIEVSIANNKLKVASDPAETTQLGAAVDYNSADDEWVVLGTALNPGPHCAGTTSTVTCPEAGEDIAADFKNLGGTFDMSLAAGELDFNSTIKLGAGEDGLIGGNGVDVVTSSEHTAVNGDTVITLGGDDEITTAAGADEVQGGLGDDVIKTGAGDDLIDEHNDAPNGDDVLNGGGGEDTVSYDNRESGVDATIGGAESGGPGEKDKINLNVENLRGTSSDDTLTGDADANLLDGSDGDDVLIGGPGTGADTLDGSDDDDLLMGGTGKNPGPDGADIFFAGDQGPEGDTVSYEGREDPLTVAIGAGPDPDGDDVPSQIDNIIGGNDDDVLTGDNDGNTLIGGKGEDSLIALGFADTVDLQDDGPDSADCGSGADTALIDSVALDTPLTDCEATDTAPETVITKRPASRITKRSAKFEFSSPTPGVLGFACELDGAEIEECESPLRLNGLDLGKHKFEVTAVDGDGDPDISPAKAKFKVV